MNEVEVALKAYQDNQVLADLNLDEIPHKVRPGRESQKRDAQALTNRLKLNYRDAIRKAALGFFVSGPGSEAFTKQTLEEAQDTLVLNGAALYERIADRIEPSLGVAREFGVGQFSVVVNELRDVIAEIGVVSLPAPKWREGYTVQNRQELIDHVRGMIESAAGVELQVYYLERQLCDAGLQAKTSRATVPVIVTGVVAEKAADVGHKLFGEARTIVVTTNADQTKEQTLSTLTHAKKQLKKKQ